MKVRVYRPSSVRPLLATLIAHGTNLGLAAMAQSVGAVTAEMLQETSRWFLRDTTLKAASAVVVDYHHRLELSAVWGDGRRSCLNVVTVR